MVEKKYDVCVEHCGNDTNCLTRCEEVSKVRLDREYKKLLYQTGGAAARPDIAEHASCSYCGMDRAKFAHSRVYVAYDDGSTFGACSIHCAAVDMAVNIDRAPERIDARGMEEHHDALMTLKFRYTLRDSCTGLGHA